MFQFTREAHITSEGRITHAVRITFPQGTHRSKKKNHPNGWFPFWLRGPEPNRFAQRQSLCLHSCGDRRFLGRRYTPSPPSTAAPRRHKLHIVSLHVIRENLLISLFLLFPKSLMNFLGALLCSLHPPPAAVESVAPGLYLYKCRVFVPNGFDVCPLFILIRPD